MCRTVRVRGRRRCVPLEPVVSEALHQIAAREKKKISELLSEISTNRRDGDLPAFIRVYVVEYWRNDWLRRYNERRETAPPKRGHRRQL